MPFGLDDGDRADREPAVKIALKKEYYLSGNQYYRVVNTNIIVENAGRRCWNAYIPIDDDRFTIAVEECCKEKALVEVGKYLARVLRP